MNQATLAGNRSLSLLFCRELSLAIFSAETYMSAERALGKVALIELVGLRYILGGSHAECFEVATPDNSKPFEVRTPCVGG